MELYSIDSRFPSKNTRDTYIVSPDVAEFLKKAGTLMPVYAMFTARKVLDDEKVAECELGHSEYSCRTDTEPLAGQNDCSWFGTIIRCCSRVD